MLSKLFSVLVVLFSLWNIAYADIDCDGVDDKISTGVDFNTFTTTTAWTIRGYIKSTGSTYGSSSCFSGGVFIGDDLNYVSVGRGGSAGTSNACVQHYEGGEKVSVTMSSGWHHIAVTLNAATLTLYVDGESVGSTGTGNTNTDATNLFMCGAGEGFSQDRITDVVVHSVALSSNEIASIGKSKQRGVGYTGSQGLWGLNDCNDGTSGDAVSFRDKSGNNRHGTGDDGGNNTGLTCRASEHVRGRIGVW